MTDLFFCSEAIDYRFSYINYINELSKNCEQNENNLVRKSIHLTINLKDLELDL
jgi:hypothetical protein